MTREELEEKAQHYVDCVEKEYDIPERIKRLIKSAYIVGTNEHSKNVWHPASEKPEYGREIIAFDSDGFSASGTFKQVGVVKGIFYNGYLLLAWDVTTRWAYIADLLPKGGEQ